jgi:hypothetical protein
MEKAIEIIQKKGLAKSVEACLARPPPRARSAPSSSPEGKCRGRWSRSTARRTSLARSEAFQKPSSATCSRWPPKTTAGASISRPADALAARPWGRPAPSSPAPSARRSRSAAGSAVDPPAGKPGLVRVLRPPRRQDRRIASRSSTENEAASLARGREALRRRHRHADRRDVGPATSTSREVISRDGRREAGRDLPRPHAEGEGGGHPQGPRSLLAQDHRGQEGEVVHRDLRSSSKSRSSLLAPDDRQAASRQLSEGCRLHGLHRAASSASSAARASRRRKMNFADEVAKMAQGG